MSKCTRFKILLNSFMLLVSHYRVHMRFSMSKVFSGLGYVTNLPLRSTCTKCNAKGLLDLSMLLICH